MMQVVCFFGADSKTGTTMTCQAVAEELAALYPEKKILLLHLDGHQGTDFSNMRHGRCLDDIKAALLSDVLTLPELEDACGRDKNLFALEGALSLIERKKYLEEHVGKLFSLSKSGFDLILADAGSSIDMGLAVGALKHSDCRLLVTTQQPVALRRYRETDLQVLSKLEIGFQGLIVNKFIYSLQTFLPEAKELKEVYGIDQYFEIPQLDYGWQAEVGKNSMRKYKDKWYTRSVQDIAGYIGTLAGFEECGLNEKIQKRKALFGLIGGKNEQRKRI